MLKRCPDIASSAIGHCKIDCLFLGWGMPRLDFAWLDCYALVLDDTVWGWTRPCPCNTQPTLVFRKDSSTIRANPPLHNLPVPKRCVFNRCVSNTAGPPPTQHPTNAQALHHATPERHPYAPCFGSMPRKRFNRHTGNTNQTLCIPSVPKRCVFKPCVRGWTGPCPCNNQPTFVFCKEGIRAGSISSPCRWFVQCQGAEGRSLPIMVALLTQCLPIARYLSYWIYPDGD